jgi:hypothetical protein
VEVLSRPAESVTVAEALRAYYGEADLMRRLLRAEGRSARWDEIALSVIGREQARAAAQPAAGPGARPGG